MPGLVMMRRRWDVASDDFVFSSIIEIVIRAAWIVSLIAVYFSHFYHFDCTYGQRMELFYIGFIVMDSVDLFNNIILLYISMKGTVNDNWPRRHLVWFLYLRGILLIPELTWISLSTAWLYGLDLQCESHVEWTAKGMVIGGWVLLALKILRAFSTFDPTGGALNVFKSKLRHTGTSASASKTKMTQKLWTNRCEMMCCCIASNPGSSSGLTDVGKIMGDFFYDLDLVVSDIIVGLILLAEQQKLQGEGAWPSTGRAIETLSGRVLGQGQPNEEKVKKEIKPKEWMTLENLAYFIRYAGAAYGCSNYVMTASCRETLSLCHLLRCCSCIRRSNEVQGDNCCQCNTAVVKKCADLTDENLIYLSFEDEYRKSPFFVVVDFEKNVVVVCIRGTFSLQDTLADLVAYGVKIDIPGVEDAYIHESQIESARCILQVLTSWKLLEKAFSKLPSDAGLVITGHSLGSGIASALAILLKPTYPDLMCYAFSPMGCSVSPSLREYTKDFIVSVVLGTDMIARSDAYTMTQLKVEVLRALMGCQVPKYHIMAEGCWRVLKACCGPRHGHAENLSLGSPLLDPALARMKASLESCEKDLNDVLKSNTPLKPPGLLIHMVDTKDGTRERPIYEASWVHSEFFNQLLLDSEMMFNHLSGNVQVALNHLVARQATINFPVEGPPQVSTTQPVSSIVAEEAL